MNRIDLPANVVDLVNVIDKTNRALMITRAQQDRGIKRLIARLATLEAKATRQA